MASTMAEQAACRLQCASIDAVGHGLLHKACRVHLLLRQRSCARARHSTAAAGHHCRSLQWGKCQRPGEGEATASSTASVRPPVPHNDFRLDHISPYPAQQAPGCLGTADQTGPVLAWVRSRLGPWETCAKRGQQKSCALRMAETDTVSCC